MAMTKGNKRGRVLTIPTPHTFHVPTDSERRLLGLIHRRGGATQAEITRAMDLTQPQVSRLVTGLVAEGLIRLGPATANGRGHPSAALTLNPDYAFGLGVSLLGDALSMDLIDFAGRLLWRGSRAMPDMTRPRVLAQLAAYRQEMLVETRVDPARIFAAGVGVSAFFVGDGPLMNPPALLDDWALVDIAAVLEDTLGVRVSVDNDGNVASIGEAFLGAGRRHASFAYLQVTNGFGGGLVLNGRPHRGTFGNAGEYAAVWQAMGIPHPNLERLRTLVNDHDRAFGSVSEMIEAFDINWRGVALWLDEAGPAFSVVATAISAVADCEAIVLGGRIPPPLARALADRIVIAGTDRRQRPRPLPVVIEAEAPGDAVSLGAAVLSLQQGFFL